MASKTIVQLLLLAAFFAFLNIASAGHVRHFFRRGSCPAAHAGECLSESECGSTGDCLAEFPGEDLVCCPDSCGKMYCADNAGKKRSSPRLVTRASCPAAVPGECLSESECGSTADCESEFPGEGLHCCPDNCGKLYCAEGGKRKRFRG